VNRGEYVRDNVHPNWENSGYKAGRLGKKRAHSPFITLIN
jgi:hypothetical protein